MEPSHAQQDKNEELASRLDEAYGSSDGEPSLRHKYSGGRIVALDTLRGFSIVSMVLFHAMFDYAYVYGGDAAWFSGALQAVWRCSISWTFLALAGWMTCLSHDNRRRFVVYAAAAAVVAVVTGVARVSTPISFGILYCMAACTAVYVVAEPLINRWASFPLVLVLLLLFFAALDVPNRLYPVEHLAWLGFPGVGFSSGDYYPLLPYVFLYLAAAVAAQMYSTSKRGYPSWMRRAASSGAIALPSTSCTNRYSSRSSRSAFAS